MSQVQAPWGGMGSSSNNVGQGYGMPGNDYNSRGEINQDQFLQMQKDLQK
ncbi:MAG: hypothetical protein K0B14_10280 [Anaerolineaceae bacterium]|nr:hypothetical protein [Anaerolineaceae bacterium]